MLNYKNYEQVRAKIWNDELPYIRIFRIQRSNEKTGEQTANNLEEFRSYGLTMDAKNAGAPVLEEAISRLDRWYEEEAADIGRYSVLVSANGNSNGTWQELLLNVDKYKERSANRELRADKTPPAVIAGPDNSELIAQLFAQNNELQNRIAQITTEAIERERAREIEALRAEIAEIKSAPPKSGFSFERIGELAAQHPEKAAQVADMILGLLGRFLAPPKPEPARPMAARVARPRGVSGVPQTPKAKPAITPKKAMAKEVIPPDFMEDFDVPEDEEDNILGETDHVLNDRIDDAIEALSDKIGLESVAIALEKLAAMDAQSLKALLKFV